MVIGNPTDVKHVAHIGADGPAVANPSWMSDYHSAPLSSSFGHDAKETGSPKSASQEIPLGGGSCSLSSPKNCKSGSPRPRRSRRNTSSGSAPSDSPARDRSSHGSSHHRKHRSSASSEQVDDRDGSTRDGSSRGGSSRDGSTREGSTRRGRRHRQKSDDSTITQQESESSISDLPAIPKQSRRRERKSRLSDGGSVDSSTRSKNRSVPASQQV